MQPLKKNTRIKIPLPILVGAATIMTTYHWQCHLNYTHPSSSHLSDLVDWFELYCTRFINYSASLHWFIIAKGQLVLAALMDWNLIYRGEYSISGVLWMFIFSLNQRYLMLWNLVCNIFSNAIVNKRDRINYYNKMIFGTTGMWEFTLYL